MNREIKFRGRRKLNGEWVYGSLIQIGNDWCQIIPSNTEYDGIKNYMCRIISDTAGEFTGRKDNNGKEIYEGDICKYQLETFDEEILVDGVGAVEFHEWAFFVDSYPVTEATEVIGNIFETPELLKHN